MYKYVYIVVLAIAIMTPFNDVFSQANTNVSITVGGACGMCEDRIESTAKKVSGIVSAEYDLDSQTLTVEVNDQFKKDALVQALVNEGHDADGVKANDDTYLELPECCWYRPEGVKNETTDPTFKVILPKSEADIVSIPVSGACNSCKSRIEKTALNIIGVISADYDLLDQKLNVQVQNSFVRAELVSAILGVGHDADGQTAPEKVYKALPACCLYRTVAVHGAEEVKEVEGGKDVKGSKGNTTLSGTIYEKLSSDKNEPVIGAYVLWEGQKTGTITDFDGHFEIEMIASTKNLVVSYVGYKPDTIQILNAGVVDITIETPNVLDAIEITHRKRSTEISYLQTVKVQNISSKELLKAACCNLAESFDTTPSIDASNTDAVTGTRKIEMLGLAGPYVQITTENIPSVRGLAALQGLNFIPGPWVDGMQLNMGAGSVVNGFESMTGQINVELRKPDHEDNAYFNAYASQAARFEVNHFSKQKVSDQWSTANMLHLSTRNLRMDRNGDNFLDVPLGNQVAFLNRWKYSNGNGQEGQVGAKVTYNSSLSGQKDFDLLTSDRSKIWGANMETKRAEIWAKRGVVNVDAPYKSLGTQFSAVYHDQKSFFGLRTYNAVQKSLYFNSIYQSIIDNTDHQIRLGASAQYDYFDEEVSNVFYKRREFVPGVFGEYAYKGSEKFSFLFGTRADYHNNFGLFITPRVNIRYAPSESTVFRMAAGRGQRTQSIFAENIGIFASNREIKVIGNSPNNPYGLNAEVSWNMGISATHELKIGDKDILFSLDFNRIEFTNQIVVDFDQSPQQVWFYNLTGKSYSNSAQLQVEVELAKWWELRLAYRYNDVQTTYGEQLLRKPLISPQRAFLNTAIKPGKGWTFDYTVNWLNSVRIPSTASNPIQYRWADQSPSYFLSNMQVSKSFKNNFEVYLGGENIFNFRLQDPIIAADEPFSKYFDSSLAWGPIMGRNVYMGIRFSIKG